MGTTLGAGSARASGTTCGQTGAPCAQRMPWGLPQRQAAATSAPTATWQAERHVSDRVAIAVRPCHGMVLCSPSPPRVPSISRRLFLCLFSRSLRPLSEVKCSSYIQRCVIYDRMPATHRASRVSSEQQCIPTRYYYNII